MVSQDVCYSKNRSTADGHTMQTKSRVHKIEHDRIEKIVPGAKLYIGRVLSRGTNEPKSATRATPKDIQLINGGSNTCCAAGRFY